MAARLKRNLGYFLTRKVDGRQFEFLGGSHPFDAIRFSNINDALKWRKIFHLTDFRPGGLIRRKEPLDILEMRPGVYYVEPGRVLAKGYTVLTYDGPEEGSKFPFMYSDFEYVIMRDMPPIVQAGTILRLYLTISKLHGLGETAIKHHAVGFNNVKSARKASEMLQTINFNPTGYDILTTGKECTNALKRPLHVT